jgi:glucosamine--fructose-6-phosphate aminotransferase (isomerizing)
VLALALAEALDALSPDRFRSEVKALEDLPQAMEGTLALSPRVKELADRYALRQPYWAAVGSGSGKIAADEIRIKLSELCYKSIATDFIEDKKHIDLSAEPLILVCANRTSPSTISDLVKEVAIFKAHRSTPLVVAAQGEDRFEPYSAGTIHVPIYDGSLDYLLATMVGHLFGYHAAESFDRQARELRLIRRGFVETQSRVSSPHEPDASEVDPGKLPTQLLQRAARMEELLADGGLDSGLRTGTAVQLSTLFQFILGRVSLDYFAREVRRLGDFADLDAAVISILTRAVNELARPIDAIKHQAKTVTVGVSRPGDERTRGVLWSRIEQLGLSPALVNRSHQRFLTAFEPLVARVLGVTLYRLGGLDAVGRPRKDSTIRVQKKV